MSHHHGIRPNAVRGGTMTTVLDSRRPLPRAIRRPGVVLLTLLAVLVGLVLSAPAAGAVEEGAPGGAEAEEELTIEQLREGSSQRAQEFFPDEYQEPSFFQWISIPVMVAGLLVALALLGAYLWWQPKFAAERRAKQRR
jgi:hypothetical protein